MDEPIKTNLMNLLSKTKIDKECFYQLVKIQTKRPKGLDTPFGPNCLTQIPYKLYAIITELRFNLARSIVFFCVISPYGNVLKHPCTTHYNKPI